MGGQPGGRQRHARRRRGAATPSRRRTPSVLLSTTAATASADVGAAGVAGRLAPSSGAAAGQPAGSSGISGSSHGWATSVPPAASALGVEGGTDRGDSGQFRVSLRASASRPPASSARPSAPAASPWCAGACGDGPPWSSGCRGTEGHDVVSVSRSAWLWSRAAVGACRRRARKAVVIPQALPARRDAPARRCSAVARTR